ncbi:MAG: glycosyltransferase family protein [Thermaurantimonas sp.]
MKRILYAIQGTGNGHVARALVVVPALKKKFDVDILVSGRQSNLTLPFTVHYKYSGVSFVYDRGGGLSYSKTLFHNNLVKVYKELRKLPVRDYDLVISDFEPISAYASKITGIPSLAFSHQASFLSKRVPRPNRKSTIGEFVLKNYAPCAHRIGIHFQSYEPWILPPILRPEILRATPCESQEYIVYLPAYGDSLLIKMLSKMDGTFVVFSKFSTFSYKKDNVTIIPAQVQEFTKRLITCRGVITSAGFETPAEALYLEKKLMCIPIKGQYEQYCNAAALEELGVPVYERLSAGILRSWLNETTVVSLPNREELIRLPESFLQRIHDLL